MASDRPLPKLDEPDSGEFWRATTERVLKFQRCGSCGTIIWYPRPHCTGCIDGELAWHESAGQGTLYTFSVVRQSYHPFFRNLVPYAVAYVDVDEGFRLLTNIVGVEDPSNELKIGQRLHLVWEEHEGLNIPLFEPSSEQ
jgi:uncharacterized OB-fold protein